MLFILKVTQIKSARVVDVVAQWSAFPLFDNNRGAAVGVRGVGPRNKRGNPRGRNLELPPKEKMMNKRMN